MKLQQRGRLSCLYSVLATKNKSVLIALMHHRHTSGGMFLKCARSNIHGKRSEFMSYSTQTEDLDNSPLPYSILSNLLSGREEQILPQECDYPLQKQCNTKESFLYVARSMVDFNFKIPLRTFFCTFNIEQTEENFLRFVELQRSEI